MEADGIHTTTCTVVGGRRSFVGRALVAMLLEGPHWIVRIADSHPSLNLRPEEENDSILSESVRMGRASYFQVDVRDKSQVSQAIKGSSVVFHMDAMDSSSLDFYHQYMFTVQGTKNVISACREYKVERLVYNSSADVVFDGVHDIHKGDESLKYPSRFEDMLNDLKAQAEAEVLSANACDDLSTCSLRPCNPFGPGDEHLVPFLVDEAKSFRAKFLVGSDKMCDFTYVENVAHAHICAAQALCSHLPSVSGKPFFINNLEPMKVWEFSSLILEGLGYQRPKIRIPARLALLCVMLVKWVSGKLGSHRNAHSYLNPAFISTLSCARTFDSSRAQKLIGYSPIVSMEEGITSTVEYFSHLAKESLFSRQLDFTRTSKADKLLGGGTVADILLWRDERRTFMYFLGLFFFFYWFLLSGRTFVTSASKLLLLVSVMLFGHGSLPSSMFGLSIAKISSSYFEVPEASVKNTFISLASVWNRGVCMLTHLARGEDLNLFLKVAGSLYLLKLLLRFPLCVLIGVGFVSLFAAFIVYEQCEEEIDRLLTTGALYFKKSNEIMMNLPAFVRKHIHKN